MNKGRNTSRRKTPILQHCPSVPALG
jgi:hypothetical protein